MLEGHVGASSFWSHLLKPGIASFSVIMGSKITAIMNHIENPTNHSVVSPTENLRLVGGFGRGFAFMSSFVTLSPSAEGGAGKGFDASAGAVFGGTGGRCPGLEAYRLRTRQSCSMALDMLARCTS
jgi:hypothetical protein